MGEGREKLREKTTTKRKKTRDDDDEFSFSFSPNRNFFAPSSDFSPPSHREKRNFHLSSNETRKQGTREGGKNARDKFNMKFRES